MDEQTLRKILKEELKGFATKKDINLSLKSLQNNLEDYIAAVFASADENKAEKADVEELKRKVKQLENKISPVL